MSVFLPRAFPSRAHFSTVVHTEEKVREERETATETKRDAQRDTEEEIKTDSAGETQRGSQRHKIPRFLFLIFVICGYLQNPVQSGVGAGEPRLVWSRVNGPGQFQRAKGCHAWCISSQS